MSYDIARVRAALEKIWKGPNGVESFGEYMTLVRAIDELEGMKGGTSDQPFTLGEMICFLETLPSDSMVGIGDPHSYRGYYDELEFTHVSPQPVSELLKSAREAIGATFVGYKGGRYVMSETTPVWIGEWGAVNECRISASVVRAALISEVAR